MADNQHPLIYEGRRPAVQELGTGQWPRRRRPPRPRSGDPHHSGARGSGPTIGMTGAPQARARPSLVLQPGFNGGPPLPVASSGALLVAASPA